MMICLLGKGDKMINRMVLNETSYFGYHAREVLPEEIRKRGLNKALLVTDKTLMSCGVTKMVLDILDHDGILYSVFDNVKPNPTIANVLEGLEVCKKVGADYLIAVGGGSVIDTAKAISIIMNNPERVDIVSLEGVSDTKNKGMPLIVLPTTSGTAAEVTINYVITDEKRKVKMVCVDPNDIPTLSIVDAELMLGMPKSVAAATGLDALTHAIEGYITKSAWEMTDMFHLEAIKLIYHNLEKAVKEKDKEAVFNMALAQYIAGMGFSNVGLGIVHSMAHQLGAVYDTPHGVANALLLPYIMEFNGVECPERMRKIGEVFGLDLSNMTDVEVVEKVSNEVRNLAIKLDIPQHISEIGGKKEDIRMLAEKALVDPCTGGNPRYVDADILEDLFTKAF